MEKNCENEGPMAGCGEDREGPMAGCGEGRDRNGPMLNA